MLQLSVTFGGIAGTITKAFAVKTVTNIEVLTPEVGSTGGYQTIVVQNSDWLSNTWTSPEASRFEFEATLVSIKYVTPQKAAVGATVTVMTTNMFASADTVSVSVGGTTVQTVVTAKGGGNAKITFTVPQISSITETSVLSGVVSLSEASQTATFSLTYLVIDQAAPQVERWSPKGGTICGKTRWAVSLTNVDITDTIQSEFPGQPVLDAVAVRNSASGIIAEFVTPANQIAETVAVKLIVPSANVTASFKYTDPASPELFGKGVEPDNGPMDGGTIIVISVQYLAIPDSADDLILQFIPASGPAVEVPAVGFKTDGDKLFIQAITPAMSLEGFANINIKNVNCELQQITVKFEYYNDNLPLIITQ